MSRNHSLIIISCELYFNSNDIAGVTVEIGDCSFWPVWNIRYEYLIRRILAIYQNFAIYIL